MTFEERIDKLTGRHEALAQTVELMGHEVRQLIAASTISAQNIAKLVDVTNKDAENIRALAPIAEAHERRIDQLEEGR